MTHTITHTTTLEEKAVLEAVSVRNAHGRGSWTMDQIQDSIQGNHEGTREARAHNAEIEVLVNVPHWLTPVIVGQLIERGLIYRCGTNPEKYTRA